MTYATNVYPALYGALDAALSWDVYDEVPEGTDPPYIVIGDVIETEAARFAQPGGTNVVTIHGWSLYNGAFEVLGMLSEINAALDGKTFALGNSQTMMRCAFDSAQTLRETDTTRKVTLRHLVAFYRIDVEA